MLPELTDYAANQTPSLEVAQQYRVALDTGTEDASLALLHYRGGQEEFDIGAEFARSADALDRVVGARILGELGWGKDTFLEESIEILIELLADSDEQVLSAALSCLGRRRATDAIPLVIPFVSHKNPDVRFGAVMALTCQSDLAAIHGLIQLARDTDRDVRNWAAFGIGSMTEIDIPELRDVLFELCADEDGEIRGEALVGLAHRRDPRGLQPLIQELQREFVGNWCLEAAELWALPELHPLIVRLQASLEGKGASMFDRDFERSLQACEKSTAPDTLTAPESD